MYSQTSLLQQFGAGAAGLPVIWWLRPGLVVIVTGVRTTDLKLLCVVAVVKVLVPEAIIEINAGYRSAVHLGRWHPAFPFSFNRRLQFADDAQFAGGIAAASRDCICWCCCRTTGPCLHGSDERLWPLISACWMVGSLNLRIILRPSDVLINLH